MRLLFPLLLCLSFICHSLDAQDARDFFWSTGELGSGNVTNGDLVLDLMEGQSQILYLYYSTNGPSQSELRVGGGLEIMTSVSGMIRFDAAETFDFDISLAGQVIGERWGSSTGAGTAGPASVSDELINGFDFFTIFGGTGISNANTGPLSVDAGYDAQANAFLVGSIDLTGLAAGTVDLMITPGPLGLTDDGLTLLNPDFGSATVSVTADTADDPFSLNGRVLTIMGTIGDDVIEVSGLSGAAIARVNNIEQEFTDIDEIFVLADEGDDEITVSFSGIKSLFGGPGDDSIVVSGPRMGARIFGEEGDDELTGGPLADHIAGGPGNDDINGRGGDDFIDGGAQVPVDVPNANIIRGGTGDDTIVGGLDTDFVFGGAGNDTISTFAGDDMAFGQLGDDIIEGGGGSDMIAGNIGFDSIFGGFGDDEITGDLGGDEIDGGPGADQISGGANADVIFGGPGNDFIRGDLGADSIEGGDGNDELFGGMGDDLVCGDNGNDTLYGQSDNDTLNGDAGDDVLTGGQGSDQLNGGPGVDTAIDQGESGESDIENR